MNGKKASLSPARSEVDKVSVNGQTHVYTPTPKSSSGPQTSVAVDGQGSVDNPENTEDHSLVPNSYDNLRSSSDLSVVSSVSPDNTKGKKMAACDPHMTVSLNSETTERMLISAGKVKYMNLKYKKVEAKIYDYKCDVRLLVGKEHFRAHRNVLSDASDYFAAMFSHNMKEKDQDTIELKEISPKGITVMLDYFYHGYITVDTTNIEDILEAARFFHVNWILEVSCDFLIQHMSIENYPAVLSMTDKYSLGDLRFDILSYFGQNVETFSHEEHFYGTLTYELLLNFLMEDIYTEASEYFLLQILLKWLAFSREGRKDQFISLLRQIRFFLMEAEELESLPSEVTNVTEIKEEVEAAINHNLNIMGQCLKVGEKYLPRGCHTVATILSFSEDGYFLIYRDPAKSGVTVEQLGPCGLDTTDYQAMSQAKIGNFLYAAGGYDEHFSSTGRMFRFDPRFRDWTEVAPMNEPRVSFSLCSSDHQLFAVGGVNRVHIDDDNEPETILDSVEVYSPQENQWTSTTPMPVQGFDMASAHYDSSLYVCGGISGNAYDPCPMGVMYSLKLSGDEGWVKRADMLTRRQGHSLTPYRGKLYAISGYSMPETHFRECVQSEVYDIETNQWTHIASIPLEFGHLYRHNGIHNGVIFCVGGNTPVALLFMYDIESDTWEEVEQVGENVQKLAILDVAYP